MRLLFEKLKLHNFMSFKDEEFNLFEKRGLTLVCGKNLDIKNSKNGTGKSSLFAAILYCLFGELQYTIRNANLRNRYVNSKEMYVDLYFFINKDKKYWIRRGLKGNQSYLELNEVKPADNSVIQNLNKSSIMETDAFIQKEIINCDISVFLRTIFLSSDQNYNFFKLTPSAKRDFIEKLFNISIFGEMYTQIHRDILKLDKEIAGKQNKLLVLNKNNEKYSSLISVFDEEHTEKINKVKNSITEAENKKKKLLSESIKETDNSKVNEINGKISELEKQKTEKQQILFKNQSELNKLTAGKAKLSTMIESKQTILKNNDEILSKLCKDCRPIMENYYDVEKINNEIKSLNKKLILIDEKITENENSSKKLNDEFTTISKNLSEQIKCLHEMTDETNLFKSEMYNIQLNLDKLNSSLESLQVEVNPYLKLFNENNQQITLENNDLDGMTNRYNYLKFIENIVSADTLKKFIIKDLINLLNNKIKYYLAKLGAKFECTFDENMNCEFLTPGGTCDYANFSSGEQMRIMIATCFSFKDFMHTRNNFQSNMLILDEFIDSGIDSLAIEGVIKILKDFTKMNKQSIYVISHRTGDLDNSVFDSIIQIEKKNNISAVKYLKNEK